MEQSVPKRRHIKFRRRGITQKKSIQQKKKYLPFFGLKGNSQPTLLPQKKKVGLQPCLKSVPPSSV
jgi:hypothetical protein